MRGLAVNDGLFLYGLLSLAFVGEVFSGKGGEMYGMK